MSKHTDVKPQPQEQTKSLKEWEIYLQELSNRKVPLPTEFVQSAEKIEQLPETGRPEFAFVGRSNVGKSSLLNFIAGQKQLARVSRTPGRTQLINLFSVDRGAFYFHDLPGYGFAVSPRESQAHWEKHLSEFFALRKNLVGIFFLADCRREVQPEDVELCKWLQSQNLAVLILLTKCDKIHKSKQFLLKQSTAKSFFTSPESIICTSTQEKIGLDLIYTSIAGLLGKK
jgi:GTP-binding protein